MRLTKQQKQEEFLQDAINKMFEIAGHEVTFDDIKDRKDNWFTEWTMTVEQGEEFKKWGKKYLMKNLQMWATAAEKEMMWFNLQWGLTYSNWEDYHKINKSNED